MASTFDALLRLELQATGENANTWGDKTNNNLELIATAIAGAVSISIAGSGTYTLSTANAATDEARRMTLNLTGLLTGARTVVIPSTAKLYVIRNATTGSFTTTVKTATGTGVIVPQGFVVVVMCDGTDCYLASETGRVSKAGDVMTGTLSLPAGTSVSASQALRSDEVDARVSVAVEPFDTRINSVSVQAATNASAITSINAVSNVQALAITSINSATTSINSTITSVNSAITSVNNVVSAHTASITSINSAITSVNNVNTSQNSSLTSINSAITSINAVVAAISVGTSPETAAAITSINNVTTSINAVITSINTVNNTQTAAITSINNATTSINSAITSVNNRVAAVSASIGGFDAAITSINAAATSTNSAVTSVNNRVTSVNSSITSINSVITVITSAIASINDINTLQNNSINSISIVANANTASITSVNTRITAVSASVSVNSAAITSINSAITSLNTVITSINGAATSTNSAVTSVNNRITSVNNSITSINSATVSINSAITSINTINTTQTSAITSINAATYTKTSADAQFVDVAGDTMTGNLNLPSLNTGPLAGFRNALLNGNFQIAQRATSFVAGANDDDTYNLDRWYVLSDGNDAVDITQDTTTIPTNGSQTAIALDVETANKKFGIAQIIESRNCAGFIGSTVTFSFKARVSSTANLNNIKAAIIAWDGTADTVTSDIISSWNAGGTTPTLIANATYENTPANLNVTTSYATYSVTANIDTANTKNIIVFIWSDVVVTSAGDILYVTDAQLELGSTATPFERRPIGIEQLLCQRFYQTFAYRARYDANNSTDNDGRIFPLPVTMRVSPTVSNDTPTENVNVASADVSSTGVGHFSVEISPTTSGATAWSATMRFDAEL